MTLLSYLHLRVLYCSTACGLPGHRKESSRGTFTALAWTLHENVLQGSRRNAIIGAKKEVYVCGSRLLCMFVRRAEGNPSNLVCC